MKFGNARIGNILLRTECSQNGEQTKPSFSVFAKYRLIKSFESKIKDSKRDDR